MIGYGARPALPGILLPLASFRRLPDITRNSADCYGVGTLSLVLLAGARRRGPARPVRGKDQWRFLPGIVGDCPPGSGAALSGLYAIPNYCKALYNTTNTALQTLPKSHLVY